MEKSKSLPEVSFKDYIDYVLYNSNDDSLIDEISYIVSDIDTKNYKDKQYWKEKIDDLIDKKKKFSMKYIINNLIYL